MLPSPNVFQTDNARRNALASSDLAKEDSAKNENNNNATQIIETPPLTIASTSSRSPTPPSAPLWAEITAPTPSANTPSPYHRQQQREGQHYTAFTTHSNTCMNTRTLPMTIWEPLSVAPAATRLLPAPEALLPLPSPSSFASAAAASIATDTALSMACISSSSIRLGSSTRRPSNSSATGCGARHAASSSAAAAAVSPMSEPLAATRNPSPDTHTCASTNNNNGSSSSLRHSLHTFHNAVATDSVRSRHHASGCPTRHDSRLGNSSLAKTKTELKPHFGECGVNAGAANGFDLTKRRKPASSSMRWRLFATLILFLIVSLIGSISVFLLHLRNKNGGTRVGNNGATIQRLFGRTSSDGSRFRSETANTQDEEGEEDSSMDGDEDYVPHMPFAASNPHSLGYITVPGLTDPITVAALVYDEMTRINEYDAILLAATEQQQQQQPTRNESNASSSLRLAFPLAFTPAFIEGSSPASSSLGNGGRSGEGPSSPPSPANTATTAAATPLVIDIVYTYVNPTAPSFAQNMKNRRLRAARDELVDRVDTAIDSLQDENYKTRTDAGGRRRATTATRNARGGKSAAATKDADDYNSGDDDDNGSVVESGRFLPFWWESTKPAKEKVQEDEGGRGRVPPHPTVNLADRVEAQSIVESMWKSAIKAAPFLFAKESVHIMSPADNDQQDTRDESKIKKSLIMKTLMDGDPNASVAVALSEAFGSALDRYRAAEDALVTAYDDAIRDTTTKLKMENTDDENDQKESTNNNDNKMHRRRMEKRRKKGFVIGDASVKDPQRYRDWDELLYSLRGVYYNLMGGGSRSVNSSTVRNIYIVMSDRDQAPAWLLSRNGGSSSSSSPSSPSFSQDFINRIVLVEHREIVPRHLHPMVLPTFNSYVIESVIHRIPGLARHYIYFNNDMLLARPVSFFDYFQPFVVKPPRQHNNGGDGHGKQSVHPPSSPTSSPPPAAEVRWLPIIMGGNVQVATCASHVGHCAATDGYIKAQLRVLGEAFHWGYDPLRDAPLAPPSDGGGDGGSSSSSSFISSTSYERNIPLLVYAHFPHLIDRDLMGRLMEGQGYDGAEAEAAGVGGRKPQSRRRGSQKAWTESDEELIAKASSETTVATAAAEGNAHINPHQYDDDVITSSTDNDKGINRIALRVKRMLLDGQGQGQQQSSPQYHRDRHYRAKANGFRRPSSDIFPAVVYNHYQLITRFGGDAFSAMRSLMMATSSSDTVVDGGLGMDIDHHRADDDYIFDENDQHLAGEEQYGGGGEAVANSRRRQMMIKSLSRANNVARRQTAVRTRYETPLPVGGSGSFGIQLVADILRDAVGPIPHRQRRRGNNNNNNNRGYRKSDGRNHVSAGEDRNNNNQKMLIASAVSDLFNNRRIDTALLENAMFNNNNNEERGGRRGLLIDALSLSELAVEMAKKEEEETRSALIEASLGRKKNKNPNMFLAHSSVNNSSDNGSSNHPSEKNRIRRRAIRMSPASLLLINNVRLRRQHGRADDDELDDDGEDPIAKNDISPFYLNDFTDLYQASPTGKMMNNNNDHNGEGTPSSSASASASTFFRVTLGSGAERLGTAHADSAMGSLRFIDSWGRERVTMATFIVEEARRMRIVKERYLKHMIRERQWQRQQRQRSNDGSERETDDAEAKEKVESKKTKRRDGTVAIAAATSDEKKQKQKQAPPRLQLLPSLASLWPVTARSLIMNQLLQLFSLFGSDNGGEDVGATLPIIPRQFYCPSKNGVIASDYPMINSDDAEPVVFVEKTVNEQFMEAFGDYGGDDRDPHRQNTDNNNDSPRNASSSSSSLILDYVLRHHNAPSLPSRHHSPATFSFPMIRSSTRLAGGPSIPLSELRAEQRRRRHRQNHKQKMGTAAVDEGNNNKVGGANIDERHNEEKDDAHADEGRNNNNNNNLLPHPTTEFIVVDEQNGLGYARGTTSHWLLADYLTLLASNVMCLEPSAKYFFGMKTSSSSASSSRKLNKKNNNNNNNAGDDDGNRRPIVVAAVEGVDNEDIYFDSNDPRMKKKMNNNDGNEKDNHSDHHRRAHDDSSVVSATAATQIDRSSMALLGEVLPRKGTVLFLTINDDMLPAAAVVDDGVGGEEENRRRGNDKSGEQQVMVREEEEGDDTTAAAAGEHGEEKGAKPLSPPPPPSIIGDSSSASSPRQPQDEEEKARLLRLITWIVVGDGLPRGTSNYNSNNRNNNIFSPDQVPMSAIAYIAIAGDAPPPPHPPPSTPPESGGNQRTTNTTATAIEALFGGAEDEKGRKTAEASSSASPPPPTWLRLVNISRRLFPPIRYKQRRRRGRLNSSSSSTASSSSSSSTAEASIHDDGAVLSVSHAEPSDDGDGVVLSASHPPPFALEDIIGGIWSTLPKKHRRKMLPPLFSKATAAKSYLDRVDSSMAAHSSSDQKPERGKKKGQKSRGANGKKKLDVVTDDDAEAAPTPTSPAASSPSRMEQQHQEQEQRINNAMMATIFTQRLRKFCAIHYVQKMAQQLEEIARRDEGVVKMLRLKSRMVTNKKHTSRVRGGSGSRSQIEEGQHAPQLTLLQNPSDFIHRVDYDSFYLPSDFEGAPDGAEELVEIYKEFAPNNKAPWEM